ncbi:hypothetical protein OROHE_004469 [Orobanche hederae]
MVGFGARLAIFLMRNAVLLLLLVPAVQSGYEEDNLLQGINSFRQSSNVPPLAKHDKADCVADEISGKLEDQHCESNKAPPAQSPVTISNYPDVLKKCKIDINTTRDGMILPVCVSHRVATLVLTNYTHSPNSKYLNDSRFTGAGIGAEDDWTVLVLTTSTVGGSFASQAHQNLITAFSRYLPSLVFVVYWASFFIYGV